MILHYYYIMFLGNNNSFSFGGGGLARGGKKNSSVITALAILLTLLLTSQCQGKKKCFYNFAFFFAFTSSFPIYCMYKSRVYKISVAICSMIIFHRKFYLCNRACRLSVHFLMVLLSALHTHSIFSLFGYGMKLKAYR